MFGPQSGTGNMGPGTLAVAAMWFVRAGTVPEETEAAANPAQTTVIAKKRTASFIMSNLRKFEIARSHIPALSGIIVQ